MSSTCTMTLAQLQEEKWPTSAWAPSDDSSSSSNNRRGSHSGRSSRPAPRRSQDRPSHSSVPHNSPSAASSRASRAFASLLQAEAALARSVALPDLAPKTKLQLAKLESLVAKQREHHEQMLHILKGRLGRGTKRQELQPNQSDEEKEGKSIWDIHEWRWRLIAGALAQLLGLGATLAGASIIVVIGAPVGVGTGVFLLGGGAFYYSQGRSLVEQERRILREEVEMLASRFILFGATEEKRATIQLSQQVKATLREYMKDRNKQELWDRALNQAVHSIESSSGNRMALAIHNTFRPSRPSLLGFSRSTTSRPVMRTALIRV